MSNPTEKEIAEMNGRMIVILKEELVKAKAERDELQKHLKHVEETYHDIIAIEAERDKYKAALEEAFRLVHRISAIALEYDDVSADEFIGRIMSARDRAANALRGALEKDEQDK